MEMEGKTKGELEKMCNLADGIEERGIRKGIELGIAVLIEACRDMKINRDTTAEQVRQKYKLTREKTEEAMERYWGE